MAIDEGEYDEERWRLIGLVEDVEITVSYVLRNEVVRIISARRADRHEREEYWDRKDASRP